MNQDGSRISEIAPDKLTPEQSAVLEAVQKGRGFLPKPFLIWLHSPTLADRLEGLGTYLNTGSALSAREFEIAIVVVARRVSSPYVYEAHLRSLIKTGHPQAVVDAMRDGRQPEFATDRERIIYEVSRTSDDAAPASDELYDKAVAALGRNGLADLLALIGYYTAVAVAMKMHRVPATAS